MATVRNKPNKSGNFQALYFDHTGKRRTITASTKGKALKAAQRKEAEAAEIKLGLRKAPDTLAKHQRRLIDEVIEEDLNWGCAQGGRGGKPWGAVHERSRKRHLPWWQKQLHLAELGDVVGILPQAEKAIQYLLREGKSGKTVANYVESLRSFCAWCKERRYLSEDPLAGLAKCDTTPRTRRRAMTEDEVKKLLNACAPHRRLLYETAMYSGLRANELRSLTVNDLDFENGRLILHAEWTKNRQAGFQPLPRSLTLRLLEFATAGEAKRLYERLNGRRDARRSYPINPPYSTYRPILQGP